VLEALHNCIAHQDYRACERVLVLERATELEFSNAGSFYDGQPLDYVLGSRTPRRYRNKVLAKAMVKLRMMGTMGFGIREVMFRGQAKRYLPLPDFDLSSPDHVTLKLAGRFIDENYSRALLANSAFVLSDILALDKVQKGVTPTAEELSTLRKRKLVEGRKPALHISASVAAVTGEQSQYMRTSQQDDDHYRHLILSFVKKFGDVSKEQIRQMLEKKWPDGYTDAQRDNKIQNLLAAFKKEGVLVKMGAFRNARWKVGV
jgi:ATP-dependent DNA helicase RecG